MSNPTSTNIYVCMYLWLYRVLLLCTGFLWLWLAGAALCLRYTGFSLQWLLRLWSTGCRAGGLQEVQLKGSRAQAQQLWCMWPLGMWDLPGPGIEPASFALQGRFLTTGPSQKPRNVLYLDGAGNLGVIPQAPLEHLEWVHFIICKLHLKNNP